MILPISLPFNRPGLPGEGVPAMSIDPTSGQIVAASGVSLFASGGAESESSAPAANGAPGSDAAVSLWDASVTPAPAAADVLNTGSLLQTHGARVWDRPGSYLDESDFDKWRRAGKPTACARRRGVGDYTFSNGVPCDPGMSPGGDCLDTTERVLLAVGAGANAATQVFRPIGYGYPAAGRPAPGGSVTVAGEASPFAWVAGALIAAAFVFAVVRR